MDRVAVSMLAVTQKIYNEDISWLKKYINGQSSKVAIKAYYDTTNYASSGWSKVLRNAICRYI